MSTTSLIPEHVQQTIADLKIMRDRATDTIEALEAVFGINEGEPEAEPRAEIKTPPVTKKRAPVVFSQQASIEQPDRQNKPKKITLSDQIRQVVIARPGRTAIQIADMVERDNPGSSRDVISTLICQLVQKGEFRKNFDLTITPMGGPTAA